MTAPPPSRRWFTRPLAHALLVITIASLIYLPRLGTIGLRSTEGHRAIPGWSVLETGNLLPTTMFEHPYMRKPPGIAWAIATSSSLFGETEFAARLPGALSAILMALITWHFARRWFGSSAGLAAGLTQAMLPRMLTFARTAEIEPLNQLFTQLAALTAIHLLLAHAASKRTRIIYAIALAVSLLGAALAKGPASAPALLAVFPAAMLAARSWRIALRWPIALAAILTLGAGIPIAIWFTSVAREVNAITQSATNFMGHPVAIVRSPLFAGEVLLGALPASLALLLPFGPDARTEAAASDNARNRLTIARTLALSCLLGIGFYLALLITNPRYALPTIVTLPALVGYAVRGITTDFLPHRARIAQWLALRHPLTWPIILLSIAALWIGIFEPKRGTDSGRDPGESLATHLPDGAEVWANAMIEGRPELLWYAHTTAARDDRAVRMRWMPVQLKNAVAPPVGTYLLLKTRSTSKAHRQSEFDRYLEKYNDHVQEISRGRVHKYDYVLLRFVINQRR